jgi:hypothetical protein
MISWYFMIGDAMHVDEVLPQWNPINSSWFA